MLARLICFLFGHHWRAKFHRLTDSGFTTLYLCDRCKLEEWD